MNSRPSLEELKSEIRDVPDFPKPGVVFKDITPLIGRGQSLRSLIEYMARLVPSSTTKLACVESRGFILGSALASHLGLGMALIRKPGKLPGSTFSKAYSLEYGMDALHILTDSLSSTDRVCIVDDVLATGGTASAAEALCLEAGACVSGFAFMIELSFLKGRGQLKYPVQSLFQY